MDRLQLLLATGVVTTAVGLSWLAGGGPAGDPGGVEGLGAAPAVAARPVEVPGRTPSGSGALRAAPRPATGPEVTPRTAEQPSDRERSLALVASLAAALEHGPVQRATLDAAVRTRLEEGASLDAAALAAVIGDPDRDPLERLAAADLLSAACPGAPWGPTERALLWRVVETSRPGVASDLPGDRVLPPERARLHGQVALRALAARGDRAAVLDRLTHDVVAGQAPPSPAAIAWVLDRGPGDAPVRDLTGRLDGPLADGALATLARWCESGGTLTPATGAAWRLALEDPTATRRADPARLRDAADAFARSTGDPGLALPEPRSAASVRRLAARIERRDPGLWEAAVQDLTLLAADPDAAPEVRALAMGALRPR